MIRAKLQVQDLAPNCRFFCSKALAGKWTMERPRPSHRHTAPKLPWQANAFLKHSKNYFRQAKLKKKTIRAGFFIFRFYPKVRELCQFHIHDKKRKFPFIPVIPKLRKLTQTGRPYPGWVTLPRLGNLTQFATKKNKYVQTSYMQAKQITLACAGHGVKA